MKHGEGMERAHDLYVYQQMTFDEISSRVGRTEKTIRKWADDGGWRDERDRLFEHSKNVHEKLYRLVDAITERMISDLTGENPLSPQSVHALTGLVNSMKSLYKYEGDVEGDLLSDQPKEKATPEDIARRVREVLGA